MLVWGADRFVLGAAASARNVGVSRLVVGLTIVAFGTSAPEVIVSAMAAAQGNGGLSVGNAIGSNICNAALVIGLASLVAPLEVRSNILRREFPLLLGAMLAVWVMLADQDLDRLDGVILLVGLVAYVSYLVRESLLSSRRSPDSLEAELLEEVPEGMPTTLAVFWLGVGLAVLLAGSQALVWGAVETARSLGVSDLVIGLSVIALGTSLPELAASVAAAFRQEHDLALGNVIGSNLFNLLAVLPLPGLVAPGPVTEAVVWRDVPVMLVVTGALLFAAGSGRRGRGGGRAITRIEGLGLVAAYVAYVALLVVQRAF